MYTPELSVIGGNSCADIDVEKVNSQRGQFVIGRVLHLGKSGSGNFVLLGLLCFRELLLNMIIFLQESGRLKTCRVAYFNINTTAF